MSLPQTGSYSPNPRLTRKVHIWQQPVEEKRQKLGGRIINRGVGRHPYPPAALVALSLQRAPNGSAPSREPARHLAPGLCLEPQLTPGAPSSSFSPHHTPHPQVCKLLPLSTPLVYLLSMAQVQSGVPAALLLLTPITVHTADKFLSSKSDHPKPCWGPPSVAPWCLDSPRPASPPCPRAHAPTGSSQNTPGCSTPACKGRPSSSCLHPS